MNNWTDVNESDEKIWMELAESIIQDRYSWKHKLYVATMFMIFVTAIIGNLMTCVVIYCDKSMHTPTNYYLFDLAISDLLATLGILLDVTRQLDQPNKWIYQDLATLECKFQYMLVLILWNNSILVMTVLAVERYLAIYYPMKLRSHPQRVKWIIACITVVAILESIPEIFLVNLIQGKDFCLCYILSTRLVRRVNGVMAFLTFVVPLSIMLFVYTLIGFKMNMTQKHNTWRTTFNRRDNRSKINRLIVALTLSFIVCWLPFFVLRMAIFINDIPNIKQYREFWRVAYYVTGINSWFSAVLNPLLFSLMSSKFRKSLKALWNRKICRRKSEMYRITNSIPKGKETI